MRLFSFLSSYERHVEDGSRTDAASKPAYHKCHSLVASRVLELLALILIQKITRIVEVWKGTNVITLFEECFHRELLSFRPFYTYDTIPKDCCEYL
jgi:hypothetical protein